MKLQIHLPTYPKYGEKYTISDKIAIWVSLVMLLTSGILILTHLNDILMVAVGCALAYFSSLTYSTTMIKVLQHRIIDLTKPPSVDSRASSKGNK